MCAYRITRSYDRRVERKERTNARAFRWNWNCLCKCSEWFVSASRCVVAPMQKLKKLLTFIASRSSVDQLRNAWFPLSIANLSTIFNSVDDEKSVCNEFQPSQRSIRSQLSPNVSEISASNFGSLIASNERMRVASVSHNNSVETNYRV